MNRNSGLEYLDLSTSVPDFYSHPFDITYNCKKNYKFVKFPQLPILREQISISDRLKLNFKAQGFLALSPLYEVSSPELSAFQIFCRIYCTKIRSRKMREMV